jgi:hypothetical protein
MRELVNRACWTIFILVSHLGASACKRRGVRLSILNELAKPWMSSQQTSAGSLTVARQLRDIVSAWRRDLRSQLRKGASPWRNQADLD